MKLIEKNTFKSNIRFAVRFEISDKMDTYPNFETNYSNRFIQGDNMIWANIEFDIKMGVYDTINEIINEIISYV